MGDVVGYGANPKECLDIVREMNMPCVKGNHDEYSSSEEELDGFNPHAAEAVTWTRKQLTKEDRQWLRDLKYVRLVASFSMVHATLDGPQRWGYVFDKLDGRRQLHLPEHQRLFLRPHPRAGRLRAGQRGARRQLLQVQGRARPQVLRQRGQRGPTARRQPQGRLRDLRPGRRLHRIRRLDYDIPTAQKKILAAGLPPRLADRLSLGKYDPEEFQRVQFPRSRQRDEQPVQPQYSNRPVFWSTVRKTWFP